MNAKFRIFALLVLVLATPVAGASVAVDSANYPIWVERDNRVDALAPGDRLSVGDVVRTGATGRVWLALEDGSVVKLGQGARFVIERTELIESGDADILDAAFNVLQGAFRFTSRFFAPRREAGHRLSFRVGAITAGIRGTDIWGRAAADRDFVALLEGIIEVASDGDATRRLTEPLTLYARDKGQPAGDVQVVDLATVQSLAPETELDAGTGIANTSGPFGLVLMSLRSEAAVEPSIRRFRQAGFPVVAQAVDVDGTAHTRILLTGLVDRQAADNLRRLLARQLSIGDAWILRAR